MTQIAIALALLAASTALPQRLTLHVAPHGNDAWSGRLAEPDAAKTDGPLASLTGARDAIRKLPTRARRDGVTVLLRGGAHTLTETLNLGPEDSGRKGAAVVYAAFPGERPVIGSGRRIEGWQRTASRAWTAQVPKGWYFTRLFVNGKRATRAREPDTEDWARWFPVVEGGPPEPEAPEGMGSKEFRYPEGTVQEWDNPEDVEINSLPSFRYANFISAVESVDPAASTVRLRSMAYYNFRPGDPFRVENAASALDEPGEWCLNSVTGTVMYLPREGDDPATDTFLAPALTQLVRLQGDEATGRLVHDVVFRDLTFTHCDRPRWHELPAQDEANLHILSSAVHFEATERCAIEQCLFEEVAGFGARFNLTCRENRFVGNEVVGAGCGGLQCGGYGPGTLDVNQGHTISLNHIHRSATDFWHAGAIDLRQSGECQIAGNYIHHMPYTAICISGAHTAYFQQYREKGEGIGRARYGFRWDEIPDDNPLTPESLKPFLHGRNNLVEHNVVHDVLYKVPADGGALYGFGQGLGNVFRDNLVYRASCLAIYLDAEFDGVLVERNVVYDSAVPYGGSGAYPTLTGNALYAAGEAPPGVWQLGEQTAELARQAAGPAWRRAEAEGESGGRVTRGSREIRVSFDGLREEPLPGQGEWGFIGPGSVVAVSGEALPGALRAQTVAAAAGNDSWAALSHGVVLDPTRELVLELDACLPPSPGPNSSFELYLNHGRIHADSAFGIAIVGGAQDGAGNAIGVRQDSAGARLLSGTRLEPGHWYRIRLTVPAGGTQGSLALRDLTAGETDFRALTFANGATEADLTQGDGWMPRLEELDTLVLRLGEGAQAAALRLANG